MGILRDGMLNDHIIFCRPNNCDTYLTTLVEFEHCRGTLLMDNPALLHTSTFARAHIKIKNVVIHYTPFRPCPRGGLDDCHRVRSAGGPVRFCDSLSKAICFAVWNRTQ